MKFVWKGKFFNNEQLEKGILPENAVKFKEPETPGRVNLVASIFIIPIFILVASIVYLKNLLGNKIDFFSALNTEGIALLLTGAVVASLMIVIHELLHALAFPKDAEIQFWYSYKNMIAFVYSTYPVTKFRFVFLCILPSLVLGFIPLFLIFFIPSYLVGIIVFVISFSTINLISSVGDFLNVFNSLTQMPRDSMAQLSGFNSYWYEVKKTS